MRPLMKMLADAGQKIITATLTHKPWNGQTEDYFDTMVTWIKRADGTWAFDYTIFDRWVEFMMSVGIDKQINCYSLHRVMRLMKKCGERCLPLSPSI